MNVNKKYQKVKSLKSKWYKNYKPMISPIVIEFSSDIEHLILKSKEKNSLTTEILQLTKIIREEIYAKLGILIPTIQFRINFELANGNYNIHLHGIITDTGYITADRRLLTENISNINTLDLYKFVDTPFIKKKAWWIPESDWKKFKDVEFELWPIIEFPLRHLQHIVINQMDDFIGPQEIINLITLQENKIIQDISQTSVTTSKKIKQNYTRVPSLSSKISNKINHEQDQIQPEELNQNNTLSVQDIYKEIKSNTQLLHKFTILAKMLLSEKTPITPLERIATIFYNETKKNQPLLQINENIRLDSEIRVKLAGNNNWYIFYPLSSVLEAKIFSEITKSTENSVFSLSGKDCNKFLTGLRLRLYAYEDVSRKAEDRVVIIVKKTIIRPYVKQLVKIAFPSIPVLTFQELDSSLEHQVMKELSF